MSWISTSARAIRAGLGRAATASTPTFAHVPQATQAQTARTCPPAITSHARTAGRAPRSGAVQMFTR